MTGLNGAVARARRRLNEQQGFTMIEVVIAAMVMLTGLLAVAYTAAVAFPDIALARQRQSANGLANEAIEQSKALSFETLTKGLASWDLAGDTRITTCGSAKCYGGEIIPTSGYPVGTTITPLVPHQSAITVGPTTYTVSVYVSHYENDTASRVYTLTSVVNWTGTVRQGARTEVQTQTIVFSPEGCLSTATHPFAAPCQPFLYGTAGGAGGAVTITGTVAGFNLAQGLLILPTAASTMQIEQISAVAGRAVTGGISLQAVGVDVVSSGQEQVSSGADNDPSQPDSDFNTTSVASQPGGSISLGAANVLTVTLGAGDTAESTSTTSASINPSHPCADGGGVLLNDGEPCGDTRSQQVAALAANINLLGALNLGSTNLVSIASSSLITHTNRAVLPEIGVCTGAVGDGCLRSEVRRSVGTVDVGGLPSLLNPVLLPLGWNGYLVRLTGYSDTLTAEAGWGTAAPGASATGTISFWNGTGYSSLAIAAGAPVALPPISVHVQDPLGILYSVDLTLSLSTGGTSTTSSFATCDPACPTTRTAATSTAGSPLVGTLSLRVIAAGTTLVNVAAAIDLGTIAAQATYQPSPSG